MFKKKNNSVEIGRKVWKYVQIKSLREAKKDEKVCALYPSPMKNVSGKKTEEQMIRAAKDAKIGKCELLVWRGGNK